MNLDLDKIMKPVLDLFEQYWKNNYIMYGSIAIFLFLILMVAIKTLSFIKGFIG